MLVTNDARLAEKLRGLRNLCFLPQRRFYHEALGYNFRMTNLQAALGWPKWSAWTRSSPRNAGWGTPIPKGCRTCGPAAAGGGTGPDRFIGCTGWCWMKTTAWMRSSLPGG